MPLVKIFIIYLELRKLRRKLDIIPPFLAGAGVDGVLGCATVSFGVSFIMGVDGISLCSYKYLERHTGEQKQQA
jgi:hypothetical protein